ncbi:unnamed protein product [Urochloa humidicola]
MTKNSKLLELTGITPAPRDKLEIEVTFKVDVWALESLSNKNVSGRKQKRCTQACQPKRKRSSIPKYGKVY